MSDSNGTFAWTTKGLGAALYFHRFLPFKWNCELKRRQIWSKKLEFRKSSVGTLEIYSENFLFNGIVRK